MILQIGCWRHIFAPMTPVSRILAIPTTAHPFQALLESVTLCGMPTRSSFQILAVGFDLLRIEMSLNPRLGFSEQGIQLYPCFSMDFSEPGRSLGHLTPNRLPLFVSKAQTMIHATQNPVDHMDSTTHDPDIARSRWRRIRKLAPEHRHCSHNPEPDSQSQYPN